MSTTQTLFILFVLAVSCCAVGLVYRALGNRGAIIAAVLLAAWFGYVGLLAHLGIFRRPDTRPPGMLFILGPVVAYLLIALRLVTWPWGTRLAVAIPLSMLIGLQAFRIVVELFLHRLYLDGIVPKMLTFSGANVDIYVGISALVVAFIPTRSRRGHAIALVWNLLGLLALANVVTRAIATSPGPLNFIHTDPPNKMFGTFPFMYVPAFFVPLAVTLHLIAIRAIWVRKSNGTLI